MEHNSTGKCPVKQLRPRSRVVSCVRSPSCVGIWPESRLRSITSTVRRVHCAISSGIGPVNLNLNPSVRRHTRGVLAEQITIDSNRSDGRKPEPEPRKPTQNTHYLLLRRSSCCSRGSSWSRRPWIRPSSDMPVRSRCDTGGTFVPNAKRRGNVAARPPVT